MCMVASLAIVTSRWCCKAAAQRSTDGWLILFQMKRISAGFDVDVGRCLHFTAHNKMRIKSVSRKNCGCRNRSGLLEKRQNSRNVNYKWLAWSHDWLVLCYSEYAYALSFASVWAPTQSFDVVVKNIGLFSFHHSRSGWRFCFLQFFVNKLNIELVKIVNIIIIIAVRHVWVRGKT